MKAILALYTANAKEFYRDRLAGLFTFLIPIFLAILFGLIFSGTEARKIQLGVANEDTGMAGAAFVKQLQSGDMEKAITLKLGTEDELKASLSEGNLDVVLVLPKDLSTSVMQGKTTDVPVIYDQGRQTSYGTGLGFAQNLLAEANLFMTGQPRLLAASQQSIQTTPMRAMDFMLPSMLAMAMLWLGLFSTAMPLVEQREQQVLRRLGASPLPRSSLLSAQVLFRLTIGIAQAIVFVLLGIYALGMRGEPNWPAFVAMIILGPLVFVSLGYLIAAFAKTSESGIAFAQLVNFPMMFLSGIFFEPQMLPDYLRAVMNIMPLTYLADGLRQTMVGYNALYPLWVDFAVLAGFLVVFVAAGLRFFRWERT